LWKLWRRTKNKQTNKQKSHENRGELVGRGREGKKQERKGDEME
jgi:hypothetical protein